MHAEEELPQVGSASEVGVAADHAGNFSVNPEPELQNHVSAKNNRNGNF